METTWGSDVVSAGAPVSQPQKKIGGKAPRERADDKQRVLFFSECLLFLFLKNKTRNLTHQSDFSDWSQAYLFGGNTSVLIYLIMTLNRSRMTKYVF